MSATSTKTIVVTNSVVTTNLNEKSIENYVLYPNPVNSSLILNFKNTAKPNSISVYTSNGILIKQLNTSELIVDNEVKINLNELNDGNYFLILYYGNKNEIKKFIITR